MAAARSSLSAWYSALPFVSSPSMPSAPANLAHGSHGSLPAAYACITLRRGEKRNTVGGRRAPRRRSPCVGPKQRSVAAARPKSSVALLTRE